MPTKPLVRLVCTISLLLVGGVSNLASAKDFDAKNICSIFKAKPSWKRSAFRAEKAWGTKVEAAMSIIFHESSFRSKVRPTKKQRFLFWTYDKREGNALGYAQATKETWRQYKKETNLWFANRTKFYDSINFIGWYNRKSRQITGIKPNDVFSLYIAYYEGWSGFKSRQWRGKKIVKRAKQVAALAKQYADQLPDCSRQRRRELAGKKRRLRRS